MKYASSSGNDAKMSFLNLRDWLKYPLVMLPFTLAVSAAAQQPTQSQVSAIKQNCRGDYQSYCSGVPTGGSAALQCLRQNLNSLSPACGAAVSAASGGGAAAGTAPPAGVGSLGAGSSGTGPQAHPPMSEPPAATPREEAALMRRACGGDFGAYCQGVSLGGGRALRCLAENQERLSPSCSRALSELRAAR